MNHNQSLLLKPTIMIPLDGAFRPASLFHREIKDQLNKSGEHRPIVIGIERPDGTFSRIEERIFSDHHAFKQTNIYYCERLVKFLIWQKGGWKLFIGGPKYIGEHISARYSSGGKRKFDAEFMGGKVYQRPFSVKTCRPEDVPSANENERTIGHNLDGCRVGFDLGASSIKVSALVDGNVVFSKESTWHPQAMQDPNYHFENIISAINDASANLPHIDAIGGSSAGIILNNRLMIASLFESIPVERYEEAGNIFFKLRKKLDVPLDVINDGEITALAGSISLGKNNLLGISLGSSVAVGYITANGNITNWINELAFVPIDYNHAAPVDNWSGDRGCGAQYLSQKCVFRLLPRSGLELPRNLTNSQKFVFVLDMLEKGHLGAIDIWKSMSYYLGYAVALYSYFYDVEHIFLVGGCTSGIGGELILDGSKEVLRKEFPDINDKIAIHLPNEKNRRLVQSIAVASVPDAQGTVGDRQ